MSCVNYGQIHYTWYKQIFGKTLKNTYTMNCIQKMKLILIIIDLPKLTRRMINKLAARSMTQMHDGFV